MIEDKKVLAIIPARGGSKGIPRKNLKTINGKPLINFTIEAAKGCEYIDKVVVSTEDKEIAEVAMRAGAIVPFLRPDELATDEAKTIDVVMHTVEFYEKKAENYDIIVLLQPTSPLRDSDDIKRCLEYFMRKEQRSLLTVSEVADHPLLIRQFGEGNVLTKLVEEDSDVRRQDMKKFFRVNGAVYINSMSQLSEKTKLNENEMGYVLSKEHGVDIDTEEDFILAEYYYAASQEAEFMSFVVY